MKHIFAATFTMIVLFASTVVLQGQPTSPKKPVVRTPAGSPVGKTFSQKGSPAVELNDPEGNVENGNPGITKISFQSDGKSVNVGIEFNYEIASTFSNRSANGILELFFDTDLRESTGGTLVFSDPKRKGFEREATVFTCIRYETANASACVGGFEGLKIKEIFSGVEVNDYGASGEYSSRSLSSPLDPPHGTSLGNRFEAAILYTTLGVRSGQTVRIVTGKWAEASDSAYSRDLFLKLK